MQEDQPRGGDVAPRKRKGEERKENRAFLTMGGRLGRLRQVPKEAASEMGADKAIHSSYFTFKETSKLRKSWKGKRGGGKGP